MNHEIQSYKTEFDSLVASKEASTAISNDLQKAQFQNEVNEKVADFDALFLRELNSLSAYMDAKKLEVDANTSNKARIDAIP